MWHVFCMQSNRERTDKNRGVNIKGYENKRKYLYIIPLICLGIFCSMSAVSAVETNKFVGGYFIPGGMYGGYSGYHFWVNECPFDGGSLGVNPKGVYEGEITCYNCDADFDGCTGYDKCGSGARARLTRYYPTQDNLAKAYGGYLNIPKAIQVRAEWPYNATGNETTPIVPEPTNKTIQATILGNIHSLTLTSNHAQALGV